MAATVAGETPASQEEAFHAIDAYPWHEDAEFQTGLAAILGPNADPQQVERLTLRAKCFYYSRKHNFAVDFSSYVAWHFNQSPNNDQTNGAANIDGMSTHPTESQMRPTEASVQQVMNETAAPPQDDFSSDVPAQQAGQEAAPPYPMTFNQIVELISTGAPIPGIRDIPDTVLEGRSTASTKQRRRKPWERDDDGDVTLSANGKSTDEVTVPISGA